MGDPAEDYENLPWCHIYAQHSWHGPVRIEGTRGALSAIRDAIDQALDTGMDAETSSLFVTDGEGYRVEVKVRNFQHLEQAELPYIAPYATGIGAALIANEETLNEQMKADAKKPRSA